MCCARLAGNAGPKKSPTSRHLGTIAQLCRAISSQLRHVSTIGKKQYALTCPHNMVNFGPLAAEIYWRVWGTPANFKGFRVLAALLHGIISERELTFTFAICYRPSVCLSSVCLSVCNVRAPYSGGSNFQQYFYGIRYLGHPLTSTENFTEIVPGEPLRRGS